MRNLKRALSLAMASVMTLGMMTVGASAKGIADFADAAEIVNADAVAVTSQLGIFVGYDDGEFKGENVVTRAQMAVICAKLLYGADVDPAQFTGINKFEDVPAWAEGYVNLCASLGIIVGRDEKTFDPDATVSTVEASVMLAKTLGYFKNEKDFGSDWKLATTAKATALGLYGDLKLAADAGLTRDNVAELVFNTMTKAVPVQYNELLGVYYNNNQGIIYALEFNYLETLGYKNFDLVYKTQENTEYGRPATTWGTGSYKYDLNSTSSGLKDTELTSEGGLISDNVRMTDKNEIITVAQTPDYVYTKNTNEEDIFKALGRTVCEDYEWTVYVNGEVVDGAKAPVKKDSQYAYTDKGAVTEIYIDDYAKTSDETKYKGTVTLVEYNYYLGEVSSVKDDHVVIRDLSKGGKDLVHHNYSTTELEKDDLVVFTMDTNDDGELFVQELFVPGTVTGTVSHVDKEKNSKETYIRMNDESTKYYYATEKHNVYDLADLYDATHPTIDEDYILYTTPTDYVLGYELADEAVDEYLYVKDSDEELKDWVAKVILADASTAKVDVKGTYKPGDVDVDWMYGDKYSSDEVTNIDGFIWKYSVNDSGEYTLTKVTTSGTWIDESAGAFIVDEDDDFDGFGDNYGDVIEYFEIYNGKSYVDLKDLSDPTAPSTDTGFIVDKQTLFVDVQGKKTYVGYHNVPNVDNAELAYVLKNKVAEVVYILDGDIYDEDSTYFILTSEDHESTKYNKEHYRIYEDAYVNGEQQDLIVRYDALNAAEDELEEGVVYQVKKTIDDKYITEVKALDWEDYKQAVMAVGDNAFWVSDDVNWNNSEKYDTDDETVFVKVELEDGDVKVSEADIDDMFTETFNEDGMECRVVVFEDNKQTAELVYIFYTEFEGTGAAATFEGTATDKDGNKYGQTVTTYGALTTNNTIWVEITAEQVAAADLYEYGKVYNVEINGKKCIGYCVAPNKLQVEYTISGGEFASNGALVLNIGTVKENTKVEFKAPTVTGIVTEAPVKVGDKIELNVAINAADNTYTYTVSCDTVYSVIMDTVGDLYFDIEVDPTWELTKKDLVVKVSEGYECDEYYYDEEDGFVTRFFGWIIAVAE